MSTHSRALPRLVLRSCAFCGGHWSGYVTEPGAPWYCPKHQHLEVQPYAVGDVISYIDASGPEASFRYITKGIDGDLVTYTHLGFPDRGPWVASRHLFRLATT